MSSDPQTTNKFQEEAKFLAEVCDKRSRIYTEESAIENNEHCISLALQEAYQAGFGDGADSAVKAVNEQTTGCRYERA